MAESEEELKSLLRVKEESEKAGLKLNIKKTKIVVLVIPLHISRRGKGSITDRFYFLELSDCSHEIKRRLFFGRKTKTNLDSALKSRDITLPTKIYIVKAMGFSSSHVWM